MKLENSRITILVNSEETIIELFDYKSFITFARIKLTPEQLSSALSRMSHTACKSVEVIGLDKLNKTLEHEVLEFEIPYVSYKERDAVAAKIATEQCPEGWEPDNYFGAQGSYFTKDGKEYARVTIRRWV